MAYRLNRKALPEENFRRVALDQLAKAVAEIDDETLSADISIHQVRKRCKKLRALVRLYRKPLGHKTYRALNSHYRDLAAPLSLGRDALAVLDAYDDLKDNTPDWPDFSLVRRHLTLAKQSAEETAADPRALLGPARQALVESRRDIKDIHFSRKHNADNEKTAAKGMKKTYSRARTAMATALKTGRAEDFHEWRKHAKYHWYHCCLLRGFWPGAMQSRARLADELGELLGKDHDLHLLDLRLSGPEQDICPPERMEELKNLIAQRHKAIRRQATLLGAVLFLETPATALHRIREDDTVEATPLLGDA